VGVGGKVWRQNIDCRDLEWKISGLKDLRRLRNTNRVPLGMTERTATAKAKSRAMSAAFSDLYIFIVANRVKLTCSDFSAGRTVWFLRVAAFSTGSGA
jgi:hypothetical protein